MNLLLEMMVDLSPLYISLKTAIITIIITFFFGLFLKMDIESKT